MRQQLGEGQPAEAAARLGPGGGDAGHVHGVPALGGHGAELFAQEGGVGEGGGGAGAVQAVEPPSGPYLREGVAAQAVGRGLDHAQHGGGGHGGVYRVSAAAEYVQPRLGRERLA